MAIDLTKDNTSKNIIALEFSRKREAMIREKQLDISLEKSNFGTGINLSKSAIGLPIDRNDMKLFRKKARNKLLALRLKKLL